MVEGPHTPPVPDPNSVATADFSGDGIPDLVVANPCRANDGSFNCISVLLGNGNGTFQGSATFQTGGVGVWQFAVADFNGDGKPDVATVNVNSENVCCCSTPHRFLRPRASGRGAKGICRPCRPFTPRLITQEFP
jgi:hypothetical protein